MDVIVTHTNADFDALASIVAARKLYPEARIVLPGGVERGVRDFVRLVKGIIPVDEEKNVDFKKMSRLIIVDTRSKSRIGKAGEFLNNPDLKIYIFDHHPQKKDDLAGDKNVYEACGATVTILLEIIKKENDQMDHSLFLFN